MSEIYALARTAQGKLLREVELKDHDLRRLCGHANLYDALLRDLTRAKQIQDERNHQNKMRNIHNHTPYHHHSHHSTYNAPRPQLASITQSAISVAAQELDLELAHMEHATLEYSYENSQVSVNGEFVDVDMGEDSESDYGDEMDEEMDMECDWDELDGEFELCRESELVEAVAVAMDRFGIEKQDVHKEPEWRFQRPDGREISTYRWKSPVTAGMKVSAS